MIKCVTGPNFMQNGQFLAILDFYTLFYIFFSLPRILRNLRAKNARILLKIVLLRSRMIV